MTSTANTSTATSTACRTRWTECRGPAASPFRVLKTSDVFVAAVHDTHPILLSPPVPCPTPPPPHALPPPMSLARPPLLMPQYDRCILPVAHAAWRRVGFVGVLVRERTRQVCFGRCVRGED